jgi:hypothetical protein
VGAGVADEAGFAGEAQEGLQHRQGEQLRVARFRCDPDRWPLGWPLWVFDEEIVDGDVDSDREGVKVRVHALCPSGSGLVEPLIVDTLAAYLGDDRAERANALELLIESWFRNFELSSSDASNR